MKTVPYHPQYRDKFIEFNQRWIETYFGHLEPEDFEQFNDLEDLLEKGAMVYFALRDEDESVCACCMTHPLTDGQWEICKLGSDLDHPHPGAGSAVFQACFEYALAKKAQRILIVSNSRLLPAIHIYEKFGFKEIQAQSNYERADIFFEYIPS